MKPHAYDPETNPELFDGVLARRLIAFLIDLIILAILLVVLALFFFAVGIVTLGFGFLLFGLMPAVSVVWALVLLWRDAWEGHARPRWACG